MPVYIKKMNSNLFFSYPLDFYLHNSFDVRVVFSENADATYKVKLIWR